MSDTTRPLFVPGRPTPSEGVLARYRPIQPLGAVGAYVRAFTRPGELVVDLFCHGPAAVRETVAEGRRALGISVNPALLVAAQLGLTACDAAAINSAFTRLADRPKGDVPLRYHLASLYRSACPACGSAGVAEWFAWDRDGGHPFEKAVRCPRCAQTTTGAPDEADVTAARRIPARGLAYYYALNRAAPTDHPARERAAQLLDLYTPRNLSALMDLCRRLDQLEADEEARLALTGLLLDCFDQCSNLVTYGEEHARPRTLRPPARYLERNVWLCFEEGLPRLLSPSPTAPIHQFPHLIALLEGAIPGYLLLGQAARDVHKVIPPGSVALVLASPPHPAGVFWALAALWAGWLWDSPIAHALRPYLARRRFEWEWHCQAMTAALEAAGRLLTPQGHLITLFSDIGEEMLTSVCLAAAGAGYILEGWGYAPQAGYRFVWRYGGQGTPGAAGDRRSLEEEMGRAAREAVRQTLIERAEPTGVALLRGSICATWAGRGLLTRAATLADAGETSAPYTLTIAALRRGLAAAPIACLTEVEGAEAALWWLAEADVAALTNTLPVPLADRVGTTVWELLARTAAWRPDELVNAVYAHFPGPLTPDLALVLAAIISYGEQEGEWLRLRPEDDPLRRAAEARTLRADLAELGRRLGFTPQPGGGWDMRWLSEGREAYVFDISTTGALGRHLLTGRTADEGAQRCLVTPGGRAAWIGHQLLHDPRLRRAVETDGWQFIKFRHLRRLLSEAGLSRHAFRAVLGLDPLVEQPAAQMPLW